MLGKQFMFNNSREMYAQHYKYFYLALLIVSSLFGTEAFANARNRRKPATADAKQSVDEATAKSEIVPDQVALATNRADANQYRRPTTYSNNDGNRDYTYSNLELNLVRPENEPVHTKITAHYTSSLSTHAPSEPISLDESETAEEYVSNAMKIYGARLHEPIHIPDQTQSPEISTKQSPSYSYIIKPQQQQSYYTQQQQLEKQYQQQHNENQHQQHKQQHQQQQHNNQQQQLQLQHQDNQQKQQQQLYQYHQKQQQQNQQHQLQNQQEQTQQESQIDVKKLLEAQLKSDLEQHMQDATKYAQQPDEESQSERTQLKDESEQNKSYDFDTVTRSYKVYEDNSPKHSSNQQVDRAYRTKYAQQSQLYRGNGNNEKPNEEKIRVSSSTEIPKAEIMKQIEKSVLKYMKELEAEGKIVAAPQEQKTYYRVVTQPSNDENYISSTTTRPKYSSSTQSYLSGGTSTPYGNSVPYPNAAPNGYSSSANLRPAKKVSSKTHYQTETETNYKPPSLTQYQPQQQQQQQHQQQQQDDSDTMAPNVEFVYKIKTRAPLQTATVKTVSKPYTFPLKPTYEQFDHTAALKNIEDFDLSHVLSPQETLTEERRLTDYSASTSKPSKLYFNSEIYHDINSLPFKPEQHRFAQAEFNTKPKSSDLPTEYKGYTGYFAEPGPLINNDKDDASSSASGVDDDSYHVQSPYQYTLKKEQKYEDDSSSSSLNWENVRNLNKPSYSAIAALKALESDSYNPKFNNNPEGYGYQHTYKHNSGRHAPGKRGKRGNGAPHSKSNKKLVRNGGGKDMEAAIALRPPPKKLI